MLQREITSKRDATLVSVCLIAAVVMGSGTAVADVIGNSQQDAWDELATPLACSEYDGTLLGTTDHIDGFSADHDECASGEGGCAFAGFVEDEAVEVHQEFEMALATIQEHSGADCSSGSSKCQGSRWAARQWEVTGGYDEGEGTVAFFVQCGSGKTKVGQNKIECEASLQHVRCDFGPDKDEGEFGCWYTILEGDPEEIWGKCIDPLDPTVIYHAVELDPLGYNVFEHAEVVRL
jgi:hypothetical protein